MKQQYQESLAGNHKEGHISVSEINEKINNTTKIISQIIFINKYLKY